MEKVLYRNDNYYGSSVRETLDVILYEVGELKNTDILEYCADNYDLSGELLAMIEFVIDDIDNTNADDPLLCNMAELLLLQIAENGHTYPKYCLWLAPLDSVKEIYDGDDTNIEAYETSDTILSDLGDDGILFAYPRLPKPLK